jgi:pepF/M3 family oligoendopeptidase
LATVSSSPLPRWDMSVVYPSLESPEFAQDFERVAQNIADLSSLFDTHKIQKQEALGVDDASIQGFEAIVERYNAVLEHARTVIVYISCFVSTNSRDDIAQAKMSELQKHQVVLWQLGTRLTAWLGSLDVEALIERSVLAREHAFFLRQSKEQAQHLMSPAEEELASELNPSAGSAWSKLHSNLTSQLQVEVELPDGVKTLPMSAVRNLAYEADREVRRRAYEAELAGWKRAELPLAAALNGIKGEVQTVARRRNWESPLAASLFSNSIDRQTLEAMLGAARTSFPDFRRYMQAKARVLNLPRLTWYDMFAPLNADEREWSFDEAEEFIVQQFGTYSSRLSAFAARAFRERWIDAEPRPGKRDGAYCTGLRKDESRVFANFKPAFGGVSTLAHELGHAYHNLNLAPRTSLQRSNPMTLAETASIFCETIIRQAALGNAERREQLTILEASIQGSCQVIVDITSRFLFEQRVFEGRSRRELSVAELNAIMLEAQRETYGDGLDEAVLHPYMWAVKSHYYSTGRSFYNYPYMFGQLFGLGLYSRYQQDPESFKKSYDDLLSSTGLADAATLAGRFGIDLRSESFWQASLDVIRGEIARFEGLIQEGI